MDVSVNVSPLVVLHPDQPPSPRYYELTFPSQSSLRPNNAGPSSGSRPLTLSSITFRNYYVYAVTIKQLCRIPRHLHDVLSPPPPSSSSKDPLAAPPGMYWKTVLQNRPLMSSPHDERDAYRSITIDCLSEFSCDSSSSDVPDGGGGVVVVDQQQQQRLGGVSASSNPLVACLPSLRIFLLQPSALWKTSELRDIAVSVGGAPSNNNHGFDTSAGTGRLPTASSALAQGGGGGGGGGGAGPPSSNAAGPGMAGKDGWLSLAGGGGGGGGAMAQGAGVNSGGRRDDRAAQSEQQIGAVLDELSRELGKQIKLIRNGGV